MAAPARAPVFHRLERQERSARAQMAAIIWTRRSHREKQQINPSFSEHLSFLSNYRVLKPGLLAPLPENGHGQEKVQNSRGFIRPHRTFWQ